jgi:hypothetical protein
MRVVVVKCLRRASVLGATPPKNVARKMQFAMDKHVVVWKRSLTTTAHAVSWQLWRRWILVSIKADNERTTWCSEPFMLGVVWSFFIHQTLQPDFESTLQECKVIEELRMTYRLFIHVLCVFLVSRGQYNTPCISPDNACIDTNTQCVQGLCVCSSGHFRRGSVCGECGQAINHNMITASSLLFKIALAKK